MTNINLISADKLLRRLANESAEIYFHDTLELIFEGDWEQSHSFFYQHKHPTLQFLEESGLIRYHDALVEGWMNGNHSFVDGPWYSITPEGYKAAKIGMESYLFMLEAKMRAEHDANMAAITSNLWNKYSVLSNVILTVASLAFAVLSWWMSRGHV